MKFRSFLSFLLLLFISAACNAQSDSSECLKHNPKYSLGNIFTGISFINPKFIAQNVWNDYELQIAAGTGFNQTYMAEIDLNYQLSISDDFSHSIGIGAGTRYDYKTADKSFFWEFGRLIFADSPKTGSVYCKINYSLNWHFLFLQTAAALGNHNYSVPRFSLQLGLMYHF